MPPPVVVVTLTLLHLPNPFLEMTQLQVNLSLYPLHTYTITQSPHTYETETGIQWKESRRFIFNSISDIAGSCRGNHNGSVVHQLDCLQFVSLLGSMLQLDPSQRILPSSALQHPFITMQHLAMHTNSLRWAGGVGCKQYNMNCVSRNCEYRRLVALLITVLVTVCPPLSTVFVNGFSVCRCAARPGPLHPLVMLSPTRTFPLPSPARHPRPSTCPLTLMWPIPSHPPPYAIFLTAQNTHTLNSKSLNHHYHDVILILLRFIL